MGKQWARRMMNMKLCGQRESMWINEELGGWWTWMYWIIDCSWVSQVAMKCKGPLVTNFLIHICFKVCRFPKACLLNFKWMHEWTVSWPASECVLVSNGQLSHKCVNSGLSRQWVSTDEQTSWVASGLTWVNKQWVDWRVSEQTWTEESVSKHEWVESNVPTCV